MAAEPPSARSIAPTRRMASPSRGTMPFHVPHTCKGRQRTRLGAAWCTPFGRAPCAAKATRVLAAAGARSPRSHTPHPPVAPARGGPIESHVRPAQLGGEGQRVRLGERGRPEGPGDGSQRVSIEAIGSRLLEESSQSARIRHSPAIAITPAVVSRVSAGHIGRSRPAGLAPRPYIPRVVRPQHTHTGCLQLVGHASHSTEPTRHRAEEIKLVAVVDADVGVTAGVQASASWLDHTGKGAWENCGWEAGEAHVGQINMASIPP
eukprot:scaffold4621_cov128-Isochrysis_galbana.AAC.5